MASTSTASGPLSLPDLIQRALRIGIAQVADVGSPLNPLLFDDTGRMFILAGGDEPLEPMELALDAIRSHCPSAARCAVAIDTRLTLSDGKTWDAITVLACDRDAETGTMWAQCYVPKKLFRKFRLEGGMQEIGTIKNFIAIALQEAA